MNAITARALMIVSATCIVLAIAGLGALTASDVLLGLAGLLAAVLYRTGDQP